MPFLRSFGPLRRYWLRSNDRDDLDALRRARPVIARVLRVARPVRPAL